MNNVTSKYNSVITSKLTALQDIISKTTHDVVSKTDQDIISLAKKAEGADDVLALQGVFSACRTDEWKEAKRESLESKLL